MVEANDRKITLFFIRHSKAKYDEYAKILTSDNPLRGFDPNTQVKEDLTEDGIELARSQGQKLLESLNPNEDFLIFFSSYERRAFQTAQEYKKIALEKGFEIKHNKRLFSKWRSMYDEHIRLVELISTYPSNTFVDCVFSPENQLPENINFDAVKEKNPGLLRRWKMAKDIVNANNHGSWGHNFFHHSENDEIRKILPESRSAKSAYENNFRRLVRIFEMAIRAIKKGGEKVEETIGNKNVRILAFGHEDIMVYAADKLYGTGEFGNCEAAVFEMGSEGKIELTYREQKVKL